jgi:hypothetical protein
VDGDPQALEGDDDAIRMRRRGFVGAGLAAAGAALIRPGSAAAKAPAGSKVAARGAPPPTASGPLPQLPLRSSFPDLPAVPVDIAGTIDTLAKLQVREQQEIQAKQGLTQKYRIGGVTRRAYAFLFGHPAAAAARSENRDALAQSLQDDPGAGPGQLHGSLDDREEPVSSTTPGPLSLDSPEQFSISWTSFPDVFESSQRLLPRYAASLTDADAATKQFWPMIAGHGFGYNLIIPERVRGARARELRRDFGKAWTRRVRAAQATGNLYVIDMSVFEVLQPQTVNGSVRFTPSTVTLLIRNPRTKSLTPVAIAVSGHQGADRTVFSRSKASKGAWLYALQAAKASITVFGVWLGHVYHWHLVTAAMQMTMFNTLPSEHPLHQLLAPQSNYAIAFDDTLLALWSDLAPPTSLTSANDFLALSNAYAAGRDYFDDDPKRTLKRLGLRQKDFTSRKPWDRYPVVQRLLAIWGLVEDYVEAVVRASYASDDAVASDGALQAWIAAAGSADASSGGNIRGLPAMTSRAALEKVLTSMLYRITVHGISRLNSTSNPALTFVSNFPHCLQRSDIPGPRARISTKQLLRYLPNTDTISQAVTFYFTFAYSTPYEPFVPLGGAGMELFFPGGAADPRNRALIELRKGLAAFIDDYQPDMPQRFQWPRNIET